MIKYDKPIKLQLVFYKYVYIESVSRLANQNIWSYYESF